MTHGALLAYFRRLFPWQHDYSIKVNGGLVQVIDHRTGYFVTVMSGSLGEIKWITAQVQSWRK